MTDRRRHGFTLIEILVVLGIIIVLLGITVLAYRKVEHIVAERSTRTRLDYLNSMLSEYEVQSGGIAFMEGTTQSLYGNAAPAQRQIGQPGNVGSSDPNGPRYSNNVYSPVYRTALILQKFNTVPSIHAMLTQMPQTAFLPPRFSVLNDQAYRSNVGSGSPGGTDAAGVPLPVLVDAWKNPIVYVPSGGMVGVWVGGLFPTTGTVTGNVGVRKTVRSVDLRPFWASAGPDGDFGSGDDNVYSVPVRYY